jgi:hypothetical protein
MAERYLTPKPVLANETIANKGRQKYGVHMKKEMKAIGTKLLKQEVNLNYRNYWFEKIILDLIDYGDVNTDIAMALMMCLITKLDMFDDITDDIEEYDEGDVLMDMAFYDVDAEGEMVVHSYGEQNNQEVLQMETFDPRKHLEGEDRENYLNFEKIKQHRLAEEKRRQDDMITEKSEDPFISQIKEHISKQKR